MSENCTPYETGEGWVDYDPWETLLRCPECKGWLPRDFPLDEPFTCKKCGVELLTFPVYDEGGFLLHSQGKICPISKPLQRSEETQEAEGNA